MVLKIDYLEANMKGLCITTTLGDRCKHAHGRNGDIHGLPRNVPYDDSMAYSLIFNVRTVT